jgi:hypothetical protein
MAVCGPIHDSQRIASFGVTGFLQENQIESGPFCADEQARVVHAHDRMALWLGLLTG